ncbi:MAG: hypothetical protein J6D14_07595 [Lachnospiraceae bacterium]|nr:hypothetical protein [Lachnospiraceae bacterium]
MKMMKKLNHGTDSLKIKFPAMLRILAVTTLAMIFMCGCSAGPMSSLGDADTSLTTIPKADDSGMVAIGKLIKAPAETDGFKLTEYNEALSASGLIYAAWTTGEPSAYTNSDEEEVQLYPAQIYMIVYEGTDADDAASKAAGWLAAAEKQYNVTQKDESNGRTVLSYSVQNETSPYSEGTSAFFTDGTAACCVEVQRTSEWEGNPGEILAHFLDQL